MEEKKKVLKVDKGSEGVKLVKFTYPDNSIKKRKEDDEKVKVEKIVQGEVVTRKKSLYKRFFESFIVEDLGSVATYVIQDVLIPSIKSTFADVVQSGLDMLFFSGRRTQQPKSKTYSSYYNYNRRDDKPTTRTFSNQNRAQHKFDDIILETRAEAMEVINHLTDLVIDYDRATVADLYDLVGITGNFTDIKYGWTDLRDARVSRVRDGFLLILPKTELLD